MPYTPHNSDERVDRTTTRNVDSRVYLLSPLSFPPRRKSGARLETTLADT